MPLSARSARPWLGTGHGSIEQVDAVRAKRTTSCLANPRTRSTLAVVLPRNLRPTVRRIQQTGEPATGVVTAVRSWPAGTIGISRCTVTVQARLPDGYTTTFKRYTDSHEFDGVEVSPGDRLPLRYDPRNHDRIEIDYQTFRARQTNRGRQLDAERVRDALSGED